MFILFSNGFLHGQPCKYVDEFGNSAILTREGTDGFHGRLRFQDGNVKAARVSFKLADADENGIHLGLTYPTGYDIGSTDIQSALDGFGELVQHWFQLLKDISFADADNGLILKANPGASELDVWRCKMSALKEYPELEEIMWALSGNG